MARKSPEAIERHRIWSRDYLRKHKTYNHNRYKKWYSNNKLRRLNDHYKRKFGITIDDYQRMLDAQGGVCKICGRSSAENDKLTWGRLVIDHDHKTGRIRGILCKRCNYAIGLMEDSVDILKKAGEYLNEIKK